MQFFLYIQPQFLICKKNFSYEAILSIFIHQRNVDELLGGF